MKQGEFHPTLRRTAEEVRHKSTRLRLHLQRPRDRRVFAEQVDVEPSEPGGAEGEGRDRP